MATRGANAAAVATRSVRASAARRKPRAVTMSTADAGAGGALSSVADDAPPPPLSPGEGSATPKTARQPRKPLRNMQAAMPPAPPAPGTWRIADLREGQCRFACTGDVTPEAHRFCGKPVAWRGGKPTSWCGTHLDRVCGAPGRAAGGASVADVAAGRAVRDEPPPARAGWGSVGA